ncbi:MAG: amino acid ABC transporter permease [Spirochaetales bacterium]|nr:amino acid ABC transporter permease [Spirochaetales bacterium]
MNLDVDFLLRTFALALRGVPVTLGLSFSALLLAAPAGLVFALIRMHRLRILNQLTAVWVSFVRGTPIILQILIVYSMLPSLVNSAAVRFGWSVRVFDISPFWYALIVFTLNTAAVLSEVLRSAILTVERGQLEAALAAGLSPLQAWTRIVLPQAFLVALPNLSNTAVNLIKGTSLAFLMTLQDVTAIARIEASYGYNYIEAYIDIFIIYIAMGVAVQYFFSFIEHRLGSFRHPPSFR